MIDQTLELTLRELDFKIGNALEYHTSVQREGDEITITLFDKSGVMIGYPLRVRGDKSLDESKGKCFTLNCPFFSTSLDACIPLIEEMNSAPFEVNISFDDSQPLALVRLLEAGNAVIMEHEFYKSAGLLSAAARAVCKVYRQFKELTKEETK